MNILTLPTFDRSLADSEKLAAVARTVFQGLSMYLGHGGYPKVEQVEHTAEVTGASPILLGELGAEATADLAQRLYQEMNRPPDAAREA